jgi:hypothetical protein
MLDNKIGPLEWSVCDGTDRFSVIFLTEGKAHGELLFSYPSLRALGL